MIALHGESRVTGANVGQKKHLQQRRFAGKDDEFYY